LQAFNWRRFVASPLEAPVMLPPPEPAAAVLPLSVALYLEKQGEQLCEQLRKKLEAKEQESCCLVSSKAACCDESHLSTIATLFKPQTSLELPSGAVAQPVRCFADQWVCWVISQTLRLCFQARDLQAVNAELEQSRSLQRHLDLPVLPEVCPNCLAPTQLHVVRQHTEALH